jgi:hypothetical protein
MPSLRTAFLFAATTLVAFTSAAPVGAPALPNVPTVPSTPLDGVTLPAPRDAPALPNVPSVPSTPLDGVAQGVSLPAARDAPALPGVPTVPSVPADSLSPVTDNVAVHPRHTHTAADSLIVILQDLLTDVSGLLEKLQGIVTVNVDADALVGVLEELVSILLGAVDAVKALVGLELSVILTLAGRVLAIVDVARLLHDILAIIVAIVVLVLQAVGATRLHVLEPTLSSLGVVLAELLSIVLGLVGGLLPALVPLLVDIVPVLQEVNLTAVLTVLQIS